jgi:hypothetical protein
MNYEVQSAVSDLRGHRFVRHVDIVSHDPVIVRLNRGDHIGDVYVILTDSYTFTEQEYSQLRPQLYRGDFVGLADRSGDATGDAIRRARIDGVEVAHVHDILSALDRCEGRDDGSPVDGSRLENPDYELVESFKLGVLLTLFLYGGKSEVPPGLESDARRLLRDIAQGAPVLARANRAVAARLQGVLDGRPTR